MKTRIAVLLLLLPAVWVSPAWAAFTVTRTATQVDWGGAGAITVNLPASVAVGDLIVAACNGDGLITSYAWASPWVELTDTDNAGHSASSAYLIATGGETTVLVTPTGSADQIVCHALRITAAGWHGTTPPEAAAQTNVASETPDGGASLNPTAWDTETTLWIIFLGREGATTVDTYPTDYTTNGADTACSPQTSCAFASSWREATAASEDPGTWNLSAATNASIAIVVAVRPTVATAAGGLVNSVPLKSLVGGGLVR